MLLLAGQAATAQNPLQLPHGKETQRVARKLTDNQHFYGSWTLKPTTKDASGANLKDANALSTMGLESVDEAAVQLVNAYFLNEPRTEERLREWTESFRVHPMNERLQLLRANLMVRRGADTEALDLYRQLSTEGVPAEERVEAQLYEAIADIHVGDYAKARRLLSGIGETERHRMDVQYYTGYVFYAEGRYQDALPYLRSAATSADYEHEACVYIADCQLQTGQAQEALNTIRRSRVAAALLPEANRIEGEALYDLGDLDGAKAKLEQYIAPSISPKGEDTAASKGESAKRTALYKLGMCYFNSKEYAKAASMFSRSAGVEEDALAKNAWLHAGTSYVNAGNKKQASMAFQQASLAPKPSSDGNGSEAEAVRETALYNYALSLHDGATMGFGESVKVFEDFLNQFPQSQYKASVAKHLTEVYFTTKNYPAALASINKIKNPDSDILQAKQKVLYNLGVQRFTDGDFSSSKDFMRQSIDAYSKAKAKSKNAKLDDAQKTLAESYYWKGESEYRLGEYNEAASDLQQYLKYPALSTQNHALAHYTLGYSRFKQKNYAAAQSSFQNFLTEADKAVYTGTDKRLAALRADCYNRVGDCELTKRSYDAADNAYRKALATDRTNGGDYSLLQQSLIAGLRGDYEKKVELLSQLNGEYQNSEFAVDALFEQGRAYVQTGNRQKAMSVFNTLVERYPQSTQARKATNEIAMIHAENGNKEAAIRAYRSVLESYPNSTEAQTALANLKDIYTELGQINEYAELAQKAGKTLSPAELDEMVAGAALRAVANGDQTQAMSYYRQLEAQTQSGDTRLTAQQGQLHAAKAVQDHAAVVAVASRILQDAKISPDVAAETRLLRAQSYMAQNNSDAAVADYQVLSKDTRTVYGAQGLVELAQYAYDTQQYQPAETLLTDFINSGTSHTYWLARAFVLLADVYSQTDRTIEARQYLLSLKSNYTESEEINQMIDERLKKLK